jgi:hypothetical protein
MTSLAGGFRVACLYRKRITNRSWVIESWKIHELQARRRAARLTAPAIPAQNYLSRTGQRCRRLPPSRNRRKWIDPGAEPTADCAMADDRTTQRVSRQDGLQYRWPRTQFAQTANTARHSGEPQVLLSGGGSGAPPTAGTSRANEDDSFTGADSVGYRERQAPAPVTDQGCQKINSPPAFAEPSPASWIARPTPTLCPKRSR